MLVEERDKRNRKRGKALQFIDNFPLTKSVAIPKFADDNFVQNFMGLVCAQE